MSLMTGVGFGKMLPIGERKEKMRKVFECFRCGFTWHSPWWEPTFVGRRMAIKEHEVMHDVALANALSWKSGGAKEERERILDLLVAKTHSVGRVNGVQSVSLPENIFELIGEEND